MLWSQANEANGLPLHQLLRFGTVAKYGIRQLGRRLNQKFLKANLSREEGRSGTSCERQRVRCFVSEGAVPVVPIIRKFMVRTG